MAIRITAIRQSGGDEHQHIIRLWWTNPGDGSIGNNATAEIVSFIENDHGKAHVEDNAGHRVDVGVVTPKYGHKYLRTYADGVWTNNLLALPRR